MSEQKIVPHQQMRKIDRRMMMLLATMALLITLIGITLSVITINGDRLAGLILAGAGILFTGYIAYEMRRI